MRIPNLVTFLTLAAACTQPTTHEGEDVGALEQDLSVVTNIDFSRYAKGPLGAPWTVNTTTGGTLSVVDSGSAHGNLLRARFENYSAWSAETATTANGPNLDFQFDVKPDLNTAFILELTGTKVGGGYGSHRTLHFQWAPGGEFRDDQTGVCGRTVEGVWSHVRLLFHTDTPNKVYDAWVNGVPACTARPFSSTFGFPTKKLAVRNSNLYVIEGDIVFDNFSVQTGI